MTNTQHRIIATVRTIIDGAANRTLTDREIRHLADSIGDANRADESVALCVCGHR